MSNNFGYIDIILLGMIAGFIILRLRNILGRKTGHESKIHPGFAEKKFNGPNNNIIDSLSNGFKCVDNGGQNIDGYKVLYMAFAESPFVTSKGVPTTAF